MYIVYDIWKRFLNNNDKLPLKVLKKDNDDNNMIFIKVNFCLYMLLDGSESRSETDKDRDKDRERKEIHTGEMRIFAAGF